MKKSTTWILVGVGVIALVGVGIFVSRNRRRAAAQQSEELLSEIPTAPTAPTETTPRIANTLTEIGSKIAQTLKPDPSKFAMKRETQKQRLENKRLRKATKQAKLIKKGKIDPRDLQTLQGIQAFAGGEFFD